MVLGMNGHIGKPIDPHLLYATLVKLARPGFPLRDGPMTLLANSHPAKTPASPDPLLDVAALDTNAGLRHANGNRLLYRRLLTEFVRDHAGFSTSMRAMLEAGRWDDATRLAHTFKGLCGSLGAAQLRTLVAAFESSLGRRTLDRSIQALEPVRVSLDVLARTLATQLALDSDARGDQENSQGAPGLPDPPLDRETGAHLSDLRRLLAQNDSEASTLWASIHPSLVDFFPGVLLRKMTHAVEQYDFDQALELADELERLMGPDDSRPNNASP
jgi:HPt (histidine-containing phosphotransfer) domain-containing protein